MTFGRGNWLKGLKNGNGLSYLCADDLFSFGIDKTINILSSKVTKIIKKL